MTVAQLIKKLQTATDQNLTVALSRDSEGNGFSPLRMISQELMEDQGRGMLDYSEDEKAKEYVVLWPTV